MRGALGRDSGADEVATELGACGWATREPRPGHFWMKRGNGAAGRRLVAETTKSQSAYLLLFNEAR